MSDAVNRVESEKPSSMRWWICALLLVAMAINYVHRQTIGILKPELMGEFGLDENGYADIVFWFQVAYAIGYVSFGGIIDKIGARIGYAIAFVAWTIAHMFTGLATTVMQLTVARFALGIGEASSFPASLKAIAQWFPQKERAQAAGIFNAGAAIGAIIAPIIVPLLTAAYGWRSAFVVTGALSLVWVILWWKVFKQPRDHGRVNAAELALIESDPADKTDKISWVKLLFIKETWAYALGKFLIDPVWWFYLFWLPGFLRKEHNLSVTEFAPYLIVIYLISDVGSVGGGWLSSQFIKKGMSVNKARKFTLLISALCVLPVLLVNGESNTWLAVLYLGIATAAHQAFSANLYTIPSDTVPRAAVASVIGIGGMVGAVGGMIFTKVVGHVLQATGSYYFLFGIAGIAYLLALGVIHLLSPKLERTKVFDQV